MARRIFLAGGTAVLVLTVSTQATEPVLREPPTTWAPAFVLANVAPQAPPPADDQDSLAASRMRDDAMRVFADEGNALEQDFAGRYFRETDPDRRAQLFSTTLGGRLLEDLRLLPDRRPTPGGVGFWRTLLLAVGGRLPLELMTALAAPANPSARLDPFAFAPEASDQRSKIADAAAVVVIRQHLGEAPATSYAADVPLVKVQHLVQSLRLLLASHQWPTLGMLYLADMGGVDPANPLAAPVRGTYAKTLVGLLLGTDSSEYRGWDANTGERTRSAALNHALDSLMQRAQRVVSTPQQLPTQDFKSQVQFKRWVYNADEDERTVAEAFGMAGLNRFRDLRDEYRRTGNGASMDPARAREFDDLYRAAVVKAVTWHWAAFLAL